MTRVGRWANIAAATTAVLNGGQPCAGGCGWPVDPAATRDWDGDVVHDRHPGCEAGSTPLRLVQGEKR